MHCLLINQSILFRFVSEWHAASRKQYRRIWRLVGDDMVSKLTRPARVCHRTKQRHNPASGSVQLHHAAAVNYNRWLGLHDIQVDCSCRPDIAIVDPAGINGRMETANSWIIVWTGRDSWLNEPSYCCQPTSSTLCRWCSRLANASEAAPMTASLPFRLLPTDGGIATLTSEFDSAACLSDAPSLKTMRYRVIVTT